LGRDWSAGAVGVIVTLLYLSIQIRQNSKMMKANSKQSISDAAQQLIYRMADEAEVMEKMFVGQDLDPIERRKAWFLCRAALRGFEAQIPISGGALGRIGVAIPETYNPRDSKRPRIRCSVAGAIGDCLGCIAYSH